MKRLLFMAALAIQAVLAGAQGMPFIRNYTAAEYKGHNQNFDIITGEDGTVYVANFEGLLYYDNAQWRMIHAKGITRITAIFRDSKGRIWTGGYNYLGYLTSNSNGRLELVALDEGRHIQGEVTWIWENNNTLSFLMGDGDIYTLHDHKIVKDKNAKVPPSGYSTLSDKLHITQVQQLERGMVAYATDGNGLIIHDSNGTELYHITEENGLCSNNVSHIAYNGHGQLWGATDNGIFTIAIPSTYSHFTSSEGLHGEVLSLAKSRKTLYAGTLSGLYQLNNKKFVRVGNINHACWQLANDGDDLLAATTNGVYRISGQQATQLTTASTTSVMPIENGFLSGEINGLFLNTKDGKRTEVSNAEKVVKIVKGDSSDIWLQNLYGSIWKGRDMKFEPYSKGDKKEITTLVKYKGKVIMLTANDTKPFPYPQYNYTDPEELTWLTNNKGKNLYAFMNGVKEPRYCELVYPLMDFSTRAVLHDKRELWIGGEQGLVSVNCAEKDLLSKENPHLYIRSFVINGDSVLWGGYGNMPTQLAELSSDVTRFSIHYSIDFPSLILATQYRYRINGGPWTHWETDSWEEFNNQPFGNYLFEVQARDAIGRITSPVSIRFSIARPLYLRWYMILLYVLLLAALVSALFKWRVNRLEHEKNRLENIVKERTAEVVKLEKVATTAKLTQGLIDRILNPLNYINNFAKLSEGLVKDVIANIEDDKDNMDEENYEDTVDVLNMLEGNLQKVSEHGANTTRTLKAMEELLKDRSGGKAQMDLVALLHQNEKMLQTYYEREIAEHHIQVAFNFEADTMSINGNGELLSKTFMSLLGNAIYAVRKQAIRMKEQNTPYQPQVAVSIRRVGGMDEIHIHDNGIGIEQTIIDKIFDPFFTTKTTGEASGVGLYLSKEIIQDHGGDITVESEKNVFTEFTITLPNSSML